MKNLPLLLSLSLLACAARGQVFPDSGSNLPPWVVVIPGAPITNEPAGPASWTLNDLKGAVGGAVARKMIMKRLGKMAINQFTSYLKSLIPLDDIVDVLGTDPRKYGEAFQSYAQNFICDYVPKMKDWLWIEPRVRGKRVAGRYEAGDVYSNGIGCAERATKKPPGGNIPRPDFIISPGTPLQDGKTRTGYLVGEFKWSGAMLKGDYLGTTPRREGQWNAMTGYASKHSLSRTVMLITYYRIEPTIRAELMKKAAGAGALLAPVSIIRTIKR